MSQTSNISILLLGGLGLLVLVWFFFSSPVQRQLKTVLAGGPLEPLLDLLARRDPQTQLTEYNQAIRALWDRYQRERATVLIKALAAQQPEAQITQYWIQQLLTVEPQLAAQELSAEFLEACYRPEVAASCGSGGG